jgi:hypothetical protein
MQASCVCPRQKVKGLSDTGGIYSNIRTSLGMFWIFLQHVEFQPFFAFTQFSEIFICCGAVNFFPLELGKICLHQPNLLIPEVRIA